MTISIAQQIKDLCDTDSDEFRFSDWEIDFIESVSKQDASALTDKQKAIISRLWDDAFIRGNRKR